MIQQCKGQKITLFFLQHGGGAHAGGAHAGAQMHTGGGGGGGGGWTW